MLKTLSRPPKVIFTTAYLEYALESYEYGAVDYLLKPIKFERFMKAINKLVEQFTVSKKDTISAEEESFSIFIREDQITYQLKTATILYIEAYGNYLKIHTPDKTYVTRETMHEMQNLLPEKEFIRVHKSYIVSLAHIESIMGNRISIKGEEIPVGERYKLSLKERIGK